MQDVRFSWLFDTQGVSNRPLWDRVVMRSGAAKTLPTRGSIVPGWLLTFANRATLNLAQLSPPERAAVLEQARLAAKRVARFGTRTFQFEHGAAMAGSPLGCGLDIAHLHTVPLAFDLIAAAQPMSGASWTAVDNSEDPWAEIGSDEYLIVRELDAPRAFVARLDEPVSQFFRKVIASNVGAPDNWDYRLHGGLENVELTVGAFDHDDQRAG